ncbi:MAG: dihydrolipoamide acetyltransferase family protein [Planctomycetia bacterium]|nr:dihydrolipoamide acetyltransferase family protein [Planctomycetia bacterium]
MATPVIMPQIGQDIEHGKILEWLVKENDAVKKGDIIAVVESEKAAFEIESPADGILLKILYQVEEEATVFQPIAFIGAEGEEFKVVVKDIAARATEGGLPAPAGKETEESVPSGRRHLVSPAVRRVARELGVDLDSVMGSGLKGRILKEDVETFGEGKTAAPSASGYGMSEGDEVVQFSKMRRRIADRLTLSKQSIPHFYLLTDVDMSEALRWRTEYNEKHGCHVTVNDMIVKAAAGALAEFPRMNAHVEADRVIVKKAVNIGVAVSVEDGLLVPVIANASVKGLQEISIVSRSHADDARRGIVDTRVVGTFTISNLGRSPVFQFVPIINPPECAILGVGSIQKKVVPAEAGTALRDIMTLCLACDHRAVDGAYAGRFLGSIKHCLENCELEE